MSENCRGDFLTHAVVARSRAVSTSTVRRRNVTYVTVLI